MTTVTSKEFVYGYSLYSESVTIRSDSRHITRMWEKVKTRLKMTNYYQYSFNPTAQVTQVNIQPNSSFLNIAYMIQ